MNPRRDRSHIPEEVAESVDRFVDSLDGLEILIFLSQHSERTSTPSEIAMTLGVPVTRARRSLAYFFQKGICVREPRENDELGYRYAPAGAEELAAAEGIVRAYRTRRIALINYVASEALNRIRSISEAFVLKKGNSDD